MSYLGSWKIDDNLTFPAITHRFDTGALTDADSVPSYRVYEDETGTAILTGSMAKLDDANTTGFYSEQIALSAANGFEKGKCYTIYISAAVNSVTGGQHHTFQIEAEVDANTVSPSVVAANVTQISGAAVNTSSAQLGVNVVEAAGTAWGSGAITAAAIAANAIAATKIASGAITSAKFASGAINAAAIATDAITADKIAANAIGASEIADNAITAAKIATDAIDADALAAGAVDELWNEVMAGSTTARELMRGFAAALLGKASGLATTTAVYRDIADTMNVISATVDANGNRSAVTLDLDDTP